MTSKEKAEELYDIYMDEMIELEAYFIESAAKSCAKIAVDELLHYSKAHGFIELTKFYEEVKQEIENL